MLIVPSGLEGPEDRHLFPMLHTGMMSYYYLKDESEQVEVAAQKYDLDLVIDSGAHTWQVDHGGEETAGNYADRDRTNPGTLGDDAQEYFEDYLAWVKRHWRHIYRFVELDIGAVVGPDQVQQWYNRIEDEGLASKCIRVWHDDHYSRDKFRAMVDNSASGFVGTEGPTRAEALGPLLKYAYKRDVKVHGFGVSGQSLLDYPFYSTDSTTYKMGAQFGVYHYFDPDTGKLHHGHWRDPEDYRGDVDIRRAFRTYFVEQGGGDPDTSDRKIQRRARFEHSLREFHKYECFLTRLWNRRGIVWEDTPTPLAHDLPSNA